MKWKKLGKIFDPLEHKLYEDYIGYAQSPQVLVFEDFVRIYFSTRKQSENGKFISHIQYMDIDNKFTKILNVSKHEVIPIGDLGCYDEHGIFPINILKHENKIYAYLSGWSRRVSVSVETGIGLAMSYDNGKTFKRLGKGPILTSSLSEPYLVVDGFVKNYDNIFHMWYIYGTDWTQVDIKSEPERTYKIGHAVSKDGINWKKDLKQIISDSIDYECQALPTVIKIKDRYHMYFAYRSTFDFRNNSNNAYKIGYAYSDDLCIWKRDDQNVGIELSQDGWDSQMMSYPHIFECDNNIFMLYNGNAFGKEGFGIARLEKMINIEYSIGQTSLNEIFLHLQEVNTSFIPTLSSIVDLEVFAKKIYDNAVTFEALHNKKLVGLLSVYYNNDTTREGFLNHIAVDNTYKNQGISKILMANCIEYGINNGFKSIKLEVSKDNQVAIKLYENYGFFEVSKSCRKMQMINELTGKR